MHPIAKKFFGPASTSLSVRFWNGEAIVNGYIVKQVGWCRYLVSDGLHFKTVKLAPTTALAQYCNAISAPPANDYTLIDGLATIVATKSGTHYIKKLMSKVALTTAGLTERWKIGSAPNGELLINGVATLVLRDLSTSSINFKRNTGFSVYVRNSTPGSTVTATSSDGTALTVSNSLLHGTFTTLGNPTITFIETLTGATGSPRTSTYQVNVNATDTLQALTIDPSDAVVFRSYFGAVQNKTAGSVITATSNDGTALTVYGGMVTGVFKTTGTKTLTLIETLNAQAVTSTVTVTVTA